MTDLNSNANYPPMLCIETEREEDGRWLAEVPALPGVLSYGATDGEARSKATAGAPRDRRAGREWRSFSLD